MACPLYLFFDEGRKYETLRKIGICEISIQVSQIPYP